VNRIVRDEKTSTGSSQQIDMANHWILRIVALIIDGIIWGIVAGIIFVALAFAIVFSGAWWSLFFLPFI
jgi:hypothetical protein